MTALIFLLQGQIAADSVTTAVQGNDELARLQVWAYCQALTDVSAARAANDDVGSATVVVRLPTRFFNVLLSTAWRSVDVVRILGSMSAVSVAPDRSTYIALHAALLRLGEIEGAAAALARGVTSGEWELDAGASATATLTLKQMVKREEATELQRQPQLENDDSEEMETTTRTCTEMRNARSEEQKSVAAIFSNVSINTVLDTVDNNVHGENSFPLKEGDEEMQRSRRLLDLNVIAKTDRGKHCLQATHSIYLQSAHPVDLYQHHIIFRP